jgi:hypothetical protein
VVCLVAVILRRIRYSAEPISWRDMAPRLLYPRTSSLQQYLTKRSPPEVDRGTFSIKAVERSGGTGDPTFATASINNNPSPDNSIL